MGVGTREAAGRSPMLGTIRRAGLVIDLFTTERPEWGPTAVAGELALSKSQAHELLTSLVRIGILRYVQGGRYQLGWGTVAMSATLLEASELRVQAGRVIRAVAARSSATFCVAVWDRDGIVLIDIVEPEGLRRGSTYPVGARLRPPAGALGKVLSAFQDTVTDPGPLREELLLVRQRGYGIDEGEVFEEVCSAAAPVIDDNATVAAAVSASVSKEQWVRRETAVIGSARAAAEQISRALRNPSCPKGRP